MSFDLSKLYGGTLTNTFEGTEKPIVVKSHYPTKLEISLAFRDAEATIDEDGTMKLGDEDVFSSILASENAKIFLAESCIESIDGLDDWPINHNKEISGRVSRLTDEAKALIPGVVLSQIGTELMTHLEPSEGED